MRSQLYRKRVLATLKEIRKEGPLGADMAQQGYQDMSKNPDFIFAHKRIPIKDIKQLMGKSEGVEAVIKKLDKIPPEDHLKNFEAFLDSCRFSNDGKSKFELFSQYFNKFKLDPEVMLDTLIQKNEGNLVFAVFDKFKSLGIPRIVEKFCSAKQYEILFNYFPLFKGADHDTLMLEILEHVSLSTVAENSSKLTPEEKNAFFLNRAKASRDNLINLAFDLDKFRDLNQEVAEMFPSEIVCKNLKSFSHLSWDFARKLIQGSPSYQEHSFDYTTYLHRIMNSLSSFDVKLNQVLDTMMETESGSYMLAYHLNKIKPLLKGKRLGNEFAQKLLDSQSDSNKRITVFQWISNNSSLFQGPSLCSLKATRKRKEQP